MRAGKEQVGSELRKWVATGQAGDADSPHGHMLWPPSVTTWSNQNQIQPAPASFLMIHALLFIQPCTPGAGESLMSGVLQNKPRHMVRAFFYKRPKNIQVAWAEITMLSMDQNDWVGQNVLSDVTGKPERTFWPTQYLSPLGIKITYLFTYSPLNCILWGKREGVGFLLCTSVYWVQTTISYQVLEKYLLKNSFPYGLSIGWKNIKAKKVFVAAASPLLPTLNHFLALTLAGKSQWYQGVHASSPLLSEMWPFLPNSMGESSLI